jgi:hypothetical protein
VLKNYEDEEDHEWDDRRVNPRRAPPTNGVLREDALRYFTSLTSVPSTLAETDAELKWSVKI